MASKVLVEGFIDLKVLSFDCSITDQNSVVNLANMAVKKIMEKTELLIPKLQKKKSNAYEIVKKTPISFCVM